jgi:exodeoxyribonuclease-1
MRLPDSFLWHDYETFGTNPHTDRPAQFAAQRTDADLNPMGEPLGWYCAPADDVLPHPAACLITGITPQQALREGLIETEFARRINEEMMRPGTCSAGFNSVRFDDAFTRNLFYRNLRDPYEREYRNGNSRWDLIDLARMCYALRPEGIAWPLHDSGKPSFRLEDLSAENDIPHEGAHDALADVGATISLARRIRSAQPRLFQWGLDMRDQKLVARLLDTVNPKPVLHTSARFPAERGCTTIVLPLAVVPDRPKSVVVFDLAADPAALIREPPEVIHDLVFTPAADLPEELDRLPLKTVHGNHVPMLAPLNTLKGVDAGRIGLDPERCLRHADLLQQSLAPVRRKVAEVFSPSGSRFEESSDPDLMLYSGGFFPDSDRNLMRKLLTLAPAELSGSQWKFQDARLPQMLFRYRARNFPDSLSPEEAREWDRDRRLRLVDGAEPGYFTLSEYRQAAAELRAQKQDDPKAHSILDRLDAWVLEIGLSDA